MNILYLVCTSFGLHKFWFGKSFEEFDNGELLNDKIVLFTTFMDKISRSSLIMDLIQKPKNLEAYARSFMFYSNQYLKQTLQF